MTTSLVFAVIGPGRPGLVERLAATVADHDGNWLESRMTVLAGQFSGAVLATVPEAKADALRRALMTLEAEELRVSWSRPRQARWRSAPIIGPA